MAPKLTAASALLLLLLRTGVVAGHTCEKEFPQNHAKFDLTPFEKKTFHKQDFIDTPDEEDDYEYVFSVCHNLDALPECKPPGRCKKALNDTGSIGAAYQILSNTNKSTGACMILGTEESTTWSLLDETDGTVGVQLSYTDGLLCPATSMPRKFHMRFQCENSNAQKADIGKINFGVQELKTCEYTVIFNTVYGCPTDCIKDKTMCSGHGVCGFDSGTNQTHCFCNTGYGGSHCQEYLAGSKFSHNSAASPSAVLAAISLVLLIILLGLGIYLYVSIQKLKTEHSYGNFEQMVFEADDGKDIEDD